MIPKDLKHRELAWRGQVQRIADSGAYADQSRARAYIERHLADVWRKVLRVEDDDEPIVDALKMSASMVLVVHLFAKGAFRHAAARSKAPFIECWLPLVDRGAGVIRSHMAIPKRDIASMVGKSKSAVDQAIARLRGKTSGDDVFFEKRLAFPSYIDTGIMLDVMLTPQMSFSFEREHYEYAEAHARDRQLADADTNFKQRVWCAEALRKTEPSMDACGRAARSEDSAQADAAPERRVVAQ